MLQEGGGGGSGGYLAPVSAKLAGPGVITAGNHVQSDGSCTYGRWSDGSCRGCPSGQVWRTGRGCVRAESRTSCSSGNTYFAGWGCRASSCPYGRTTAGHCRSAPTTTVRAAAATRPTTTTAATTTTIQPTTTTTTTTTTIPASCGNRGRRPDGSCRACEKLDEYHDGQTGCVKKTAPAPGDLKCLGDGLVYYSGYGGCREPSCPHGRDSFGFCIDVPSKPRNVKADGDSRGLSGVGGRVVVEWEASARATGYEVRYKQTSLTADSCDTPGCTDWRNGPSVTRLSATIPTLEIEETYHIQVRAVNSTGGASGWSDTVYAYPTRTPATKGNTVDEVIIKGYISPTTYTYRICPHTLAGMSSSDQRAWIAEVVEGFDYWKDATGLVDSKHDTNLLCSSDTTRPSHEIQSSTNLANNLVEQVSIRIMDMRCRREDQNDPPALGCAEPTYFNDGDQIMSTRISIRQGLGQTPRKARGSTATRCTLLNRGSYA